MMREIYLRYSTTYKKNIFIYIYFKGIMSRTYADLHILQWAGIGPC